MTKIYALVNQKGGVGKTTTVVNLGAYLAGSGRRTLVVDVDPQANATSAMGYDKYQVNGSIYDLILQRRDAEDVILTNSDDLLCLIPSHTSLAGAEVEIVNEIGRDHRLRQALSPVLDQFEYILLDCPPSLGLLTVNALTASDDGVIIPVQCEYLALEGLSQLLQTLDLVRKFLNADLNIRGLVMTMYDKRTNLSRQVVAEVRQHFAGQVFRTIIPRNIRLSEAPSFGLPIDKYAPNSAGAMAYKVLAAELVNGDKNKEAGS